MKLTGLHLLLTYKCTFECDHCFVWGSPWQEGTLTLAQIREILRQANDLGTVKWIFFEGGEPFLYYALMLRGVRLAVEAGFNVGIVSNAYWATGEEEALEWLKPLAGIIQDLSISSDLYHWEEKISLQVQYACTAARQLGISVGTISIAQPEGTNASQAVGQLPEGESAVMYRGRACEKLVPRAVRKPWTDFTECPHEDLREPGRVHIDPLGYLHLCQGITSGSLFHKPLTEICASYDAEMHPIVGPMLEGGPVELVRVYDLPHEETYADACHLCYEARQSLRSRFPETLTPDQMYGVIEGT
jgi:hypothetical protein